MKSDSFHEYVLRDLFRGMTGITSRAMFGGWAFYKNGAIFAIIADGELYFKTDAESRPDFERRGSRPFVYNKGKVKSTTMSYWILPAEIAEDAASLERWIERSARISGRKKR